VKTEQVIDALAALAQRSRLAIFRLLVESGPAGLAAGAIGEKLELPPATLSFHLAHLARAGLVNGRQEGRFVIYSANFDNMNSLLGYLTENCCSGTSCAPTARPPGASASRRRATAKA
jgi:DNA-binding transcriptional ArsR family regulator